MRRLVVLAATLLVTTGCEEQEAVPLGRSVPVAALLLLVLAGIVGGGWVLLERRSVRRPPAVPTAAAGLRSVVALLAVLAAGAVVGLTLLFVNAVAFGYRETTYQVLSWDDTVGISWFLVGAGGLLALAELRLAAALVRGSKVAPWVAGAQIALVAMPGLASGL